MSSNRPNTFTPRLTPTYILHMKPCNAYSVFRHVSYILAKPEYYCQYDLEGHNSEGCKNNANVQIVAAIILHAPKKLFQIKRGKHHLVYYGERQNILYMI